MCGPFLPVRPLPFTPQPPNSTPSPSLCASTSHARVRASVYTAFIKRSRDPERSIEWPQCGPWSPLTTKDALTCLTKQCGSNYTSCKPHSSYVWRILKSAIYPSSRTVTRLIPAVTGYIVCAFKYLNRLPNMRPKNKTKKTTKKSPQKSMATFLKRFFFLTLINAFLSFLSQ